MKNKDIKQLYKNLKLVYTTVEQDPKFNYDLTSNTEHVLSCYGLFNYSFPSVSNIAPNVVQYTNPNEIEELVNTLFIPGMYWKDVVSKLNWLSRCRMILKYLKKESKKR